MISDRISLRFSSGRTALALLICGLLFADAARAETVVARRRIGNNTESLAYDPFRDRVLAIDGNDVIGIAVHPLDEAVLATHRNESGGIVGLGYRKLFDVLALDRLGRTPRGMVYVPPQNRFYFSSKYVDGATTLFSTDDEGHLRSPINIRGLDTSGWVQWEGLGWIPPGAPAHGGTIVGLGARTNFISHIFYIRLDGTLEAEVTPEPETPLEDYLCGVQYWPQRPGTLLLTNCTGHRGVWAVDMRTGALVGDPVHPLIPQPEGDGVEGIVVRKNGQVLLNTYEGGRLYAYDAALHRTAGQDRLFTVGLGADVFRLAWNSDASELIGVSPTRVVALSPDLRTARRLFDLDVNHELQNATGGGLSYLGQGQLAVANRGYPRGIDIANLVSDPGNPNSGVGFSLSRLLFLPPTYPEGAAFNPRGVGAFGPDRFLVRVVGDANALKVVSRSGAPESSIYPDGVLPTRFPDLPLSAPTVGFEAQFYDAGFGSRIFTGSDIYDGNGTLLHTIDVSALGITDPPLANGVWISGNTFAAVDGQTSTVIVYTVP
jgi:hypothetical protein